MRAILLIGMMLAPGAAWAGCANYIDGSLDAPAPRVTICYQGFCQDTVIEFECGNAHGIQIGYANGWRVDYEDGEELVSYRGVRVKNLAPLSCAPIDINACRFPDLPTDIATPATPPTPEPKP